MLAAEPRVDLLALDEALTMLAALHPRQSEIVEMRYFGGRGEEEIAEVLKVSVRTVLQEAAGAVVALSRIETRGWG